MFIRLLILFTVVPLVELALLIKLGNLIGLWPTILIVIATGVLGAALARSQGTRTVGAIRAELAQGRAPTESLINGLLILVGGVVLLTPGLLTDLLGFSLLVPFIGWCAFLPTSPPAYFPASSRLFLSYFPSEAGGFILHFQLILCTC